MEYPYLRLFPQGIDPKKSSTKVLYSESADKEDIEIEI